MPNLPAILDRAEPGAHFAGIAARFIADLEPADRAGRALFSTLAYNGCPGSARSPRSGSRTFRDHGDFQTF